MGQRGPASSHPSGHGHITAKGYHRIQHDGRQRLMHDVVWEQAHGPVPDGFDVHHINEDKQDNRLANLNLLSTLDHKRGHSPHYRRRDATGEWERDCSICGEWKPATAEHFYVNARGWILYGRCRPCHIGRVVADKQQRRMR